MLPTLLLAEIFLVVILILLSPSLSGSIDQFQFSNGFSSLAVMLLGLVMLFLIAIVEELGWRGFAINSLMSCFSLLQKSALLDHICYSRSILSLFLSKDTRSGHLLHDAGGLRS